MKKIITLTETELVTLVKKVISEGVDTKGGFGIIFAFPDYEIKGYGGENFWKQVSRTIHGGEKTGSWGKLGHGGVILIDSLGNTYLFEFGRYGTPQGWGKVVQKNLGKIAKIETRPGKLYGTREVLTNAKQVCTIAKAKTEGEGPKLKMKAAVVKLTNFKAAYDFAKDNGKNRQYEEIDFWEGGPANCGTYANDTLLAGGVPHNFIGSCVQYPSNIVDRYYPFSEEFFSSI